MPPGIPPCVLDQSRSLGIVSWDSGRGFYLSTPTNGECLANVIAPQGAARSVLVPTLNEILTADPDQFVTKYTDIAAINLACATGLPGSVEIDIPKCLAIIDRMAEAKISACSRPWGSTARRVDGSANVLTE
jgi:hypothetical protein